MIEGPRCWISSPASPSICCGSDPQKAARKLNVPRNGSMSFPTAGQSTCSADFLSSLHACLSLNTCGTRRHGLVVGVGGAKLNGRRRGGEMQEKIQSVLICVYAAVCGRINLSPLFLTFLSHLSNSLSLLPPTTTNTTLTFSPSLSLQGYSLLLSQAGITARFSSLLSDDHVRLLNVSASFVA